MKSKSNKNHVRRLSVFMAFALAVNSFLVFGAVFAAQAKDIEIQPIEGEVLINTSDVFLSKRENDTYTKLVSRPFSVTYQAYSSDTELYIDEEEIEDDDSEDVDPFTNRPEVSFCEFYGISEDDYNILVKTVTKEYGYGGFEGQAAILGAILNRVKSDKFPNTVREVIAQEGQFHPTYVEEPFIEPSEQVLLALETALNGVDYSNGAIYFCNPSIVYDKKVLAWFESLEVTYELPDAVFYR